MKQDNGVIKKTVQVVTEINGERSIEEYKGTEEFLVDLFWSLPLKRRMNLLLELSMKEAKVAIDTLEKETEKERVLNEIQNI